MNEEHYGLRKFTSNIRSINNSHSIRINMSKKIMLIAFLSMHFACPAKLLSDISLLIQQLKLEEDIACLSKYMIEESCLLDKHRAVALKFWRAHGDQDKATSLDEFMIKLCQAFVVEKEYQQREAIKSQAAFRNKRLGERRLRVCSDASERKAERHAEVRSAELVD